MPHINAAGLTLIENFEGCELKAYQDSGGIWTIGYGHTGPDVHPGEIITHFEAQTLLAKDVASAEQKVQQVVQIVLTPNEFSALVSFQFNTGALPSSPALALINAHQFPSAWDDHLCLYIRDANGTALEGLIRRRAAERALFFTV